MKSFYYNIDDAEFIDPSGEKIPRCVPELFYQEMAEWRIFLRDRENRPRDISSIVGWSAAVDCDYSGDSAPMCRTTSENITPDGAEGSVAVRIDAATAEFLAAVNGSRQRRAFFELYGVNATGERELYLGFEISARMILDAAPGTAQEVPETFATRLYVDLAVGNAAAAVSETLGQELAERTTGAEARAIASAVVGSGGYVDGSGARAIAEDVMSSGGTASGAIVSGAEFKTSVGGYLLTYTGSGGLMVSGGGVALQVSSGAVSAGVDDGDHQARVTITSGGIVLDTSDPTNIANVTVIPGEVNITGNTGVGGVGVIVNDRPVLTELVTSTDTTTTSANIAELAGGMMYVYTQPLTSLSVASIAGGMQEAWVKFTVASGGSVSIDDSGFEWWGGRPSVYEGGSSYAVGAWGGMLVCNKLEV